MRPGQRRRIPGATRGAGLHSQGGPSEGWLCGERARWENRKVNAACAFQEAEREAVRELSSSPKQEPICGVRSRDGLRLLPRVRLWKRGDVGDRHQNCGHTSCERQSLHPFLPPGSPSPQGRRKPRLATQYVAFCISLCVKILYRHL